MAIAFVIGTGQGSSNGNTVTTSAIDTTGATLLVLAVGAAAAYSSPPTDSKGNTWTPRTTADRGAGVRNKLYYAENPTVGSGHTFTFTETGSSPSICIGAFSGTKTSAVYDTESAGAATANPGTTIQPGSATPSQDNCVLVSGVTHGSDSVSINSSFTEVVDVGPAANHWSAAMAYKIQTSLGAENPTWTEAGADGGGGQAATMAVFKSATAGSAALTGSAIGGITEADIVGGSKTIVITLTGDTWIA
jgi:hypothetical protein